ncbi:HAMP domain-containing sensor histidine kinase [Dermatophilaceae bacterium Soc4.6]
MTSLSVAATRATVTLSLSRRTYLAWGLLAICCAVLMWELPGDETIPYHVAWAGFALAFGARVWSMTQAWLALAIFTAVTGGILAVRVAEGVLLWQEITEVPLMSLIMALLVLNVRRRQDALRVVTSVAHRQKQQAADQVLLTRLTSHEMRSPLTIASGYLELLRLSEPDARRADDLDIVREELERVTRTTERLLRVIRLQHQPGTETIDMPGVVAETVRRWAGMMQRQWVVDADGAGELVGSPERMRVVLDTLVENAIRYTATGDTIRVHASQARGTLVLGVADSGPGISASRRIWLNAEGTSEGFSPPLEGDARTQTGLGLGIVRSVAVARGGRLMVDQAREGGAFVAISVPLATTDARPIQTAMLDSALRTLPPARQATG